MDPVELQRTTLVTLLEGLSDEQWAAETLCDGWDAGDMCAHLLVREREPWASAGLLIPPLAWLHEKRMRARKQKGRQTLVRQLREGPPTLVTKGVIGRVQVGEDYIHAEDIRRGGAASSNGSAADLTPDDGTSDPRIAKILWESVGRFALQTLGGVTADGAIALTDGDRTRTYTLGGRLARKASDPDPARTVTVTGPVGELLLFTTGRSAARVTVDGPDDLVAAVTDSRRGV